MPIAPVGIFVCPVVLCTSFEVVTEAVMRNKDPLEKRQDPRSDDYLILQFSSLYYCSSNCTHLS
jgi:hypothetical protein